MAEGRKTTRAPRTIYGGKIRPGETPGMVTRVLIAINVVMFVITVASGAGVINGSGNSSIYEHLALTPPAVANGEWWRLFSSAFLHFGILHIAFNMYALWIFGPVLESVMGKLRFAALYLLAGLGGSILSVALGPLYATSAGASGAIFGLFGAFYLIARHRNYNTQSIAFTIVANLVLSFSVSNIDWRGHVGGLVAGTVVAAVIAYAPHARRNLVQAAGVGVVGVLLAVAAVVAANHDDTRCHEAFVKAQAGDQEQARAAAFCLAYDPKATIGG